MNRGTPTDLIIRPLQRIRQFQRLRRLRRLQRRPRSNAEEPTPTIGLDFASVFAANGRRLMEDRITCTDGTSKLPMRIR
jgi:hypothetical protein